VTVLAQPSWACRSSGRAAPGRRAPLSRHSACEGSPRFRPRGPRD